MHCDFSLDILPISNSSGTGSARAALVDSSVGILKSKNLPSTNQHRVHC
jgi:hypothetical protein